MKTNKYKIQGKEKNCLANPTQAYCQEALESGICDVIKINLKRRDATRSVKGNQPLNIKKGCIAANFKARITKFYHTSRCNPSFQT